MKHLTLLDLSKNNISADGVKTLLNAYEKATRPVCQNLEDIDLSGNPISDEGFKFVAKLTQHLKLKVLKLNNCRITDNVNIGDLKLNFNALECLDMSNNLIKQTVVGSLVAALSPSVLTDLELDNVGVDGGVVACMAGFMDRAKDLKMRRFSLSNCKLVDGQFMRIFRFVCFISF